MVSAVSAAVVAASAVVVVAAASAAGAAAGAGRQSTSLFYFLSRLIITYRIDALKDNAIGQCNRGFIQTKKIEKCPVVLLIVAYYWLPSYSHLNMHELLRLYDISRGVSLRSCQHE